LIFKCYKNKNIVTTNSTLKPFIFGLKALGEKTLKKCVFTGEKNGHLSR